MGTMLAVAAFFRIFSGRARGPLFGGQCRRRPMATGPNPLLQNHILDDHPPPHAVLRLRGDDGAFWHRRGGAFAWRALRRLAQDAAALDHDAVALFIGGHRAGLVVGLRGAWVGAGYWAWDPVENASFLPWLAATGYLHSTVVQERKRILKAWTLSLVLGAPSC